MKLKNCINRFINLEENAAKLYNKIADISDGKISETAIIFANQEDKHAEVLINFRLDINDIEVLNGGKTLDKFEKENIEDLNSNIEFKTEKDFFKFALQSEKDTIVLYEEFKKLMEKDTKGDLLFDNLINEEKKHMYFILKTLHELK